MSRQLFDKLIFSYYCQEYEFGFICIKQKKKNRSVKDLWDFHYSGEIYI